MAGEEFEETLFCGGGERAVDAERGGEGGGVSERRCGHAVLPVKRFCSVASCEFGSCEWAWLGLEGVAGGGEGEDEGFARDRFKVGLDGPGEAVRDAACEREGFDLEVEAAVALFVAPVGVEAVEEAVVARGGDLVDVSAARDAVAVGGIEGGEGDVDGGVEDDGE